MCRHSRLVPVVDLTQSQKNMQPPLMNLFMMAAGSFDPIQTTMAAAQNNPYLVIDRNQRWSQRTDGKAATNAPAIAAAGPAAKEDSYTSNELWSALAQLRRSTAKRPSPRANQERNRNGRRSAVLLRNYCHDSRPSVPHPQRIAYDKLVAVGVALTFQLNVDTKGHGQGCGGMFPPLARSSGCRISDQSLFYLFATLTPLPMAPLTSPGGGGGGNSSSRGGGGPGSSTDKRANRTRFTDYKANVAY